MADFYSDMQVGREGAVGKTLIQKKMDLERALANLKLEHIYSQCANSGSMIRFLFLSMLPFLLFSFGEIPWYYSVPVVATIYAFFVNGFEQKYRDTAVKIVSDHKLMTLVATEMPRWVKNDSAPCEWVNDMMGQCWEQLALHGRNKVGTKVLVV